MHHNIITLTTDFGYEDPYVGIVKGVILEKSPDARIIDITHGLASYDIEQAAFMINYSYHYYPRRTVHVVVVDPGVGSPRRPLIASINDHFFVCPDNGILSFILADCTYSRVHHATAEHYFLPSVSNTFHARDVFAPAAAYLVRYLDASIFGDEITDYVTLPLQRPTVENGALRGAILHIDKFGNLISNITWDHLLQVGPCESWSQLSITCGNSVIEGISSYYQQRPDREFVALFGGAGYIEIAAPNGSAHRTLGVALHEPIVIKQA